MNYSIRTIKNYNGNDYLFSPLDIDYINRTLSITGEINDESATVINSALRTLARASNEDITLYIQSPGGSVSAGFSIYDSIKSIKCDVITVGCGMIASMAAFLLATAGAKGKRYMQPNAEILIHQPLGGTSGQASEMKIHVEHILKIRKRLNILLSESTSQPVEQIEVDTERDYIMDAQSALRYGLIDKIGDPFEI